MSLIELFIIAVGLSMDACAVAICKGLCMPKINYKQAVKIGVYFGFFQGSMPLIGYFVGVQFNTSIQNLDHWIAFALLGIIGLNMIKESRTNEEPISCDLHPKEMIVLSLATSIDALAIGVSFAFLEVDIIPAVSFIGIITFILSILGVKIGSVFGLKCKSKAELTGGLILIIMGIRILIEHMN
ncbi:MAG: manganese efflux pump [Clostridiales bacterium]|nr:manganese efflux pump [Clostridiales bacterium]